MKIITFTFLSAFLLFGCSTETVFVVLREVPTNPSFVVMPVNDYLYQVEFANRIESYIVACGVKVVNRPAPKEIESTKQATQLGAQSTQVAGAQATLTERYFAFDETDANYIVYTYADTKQIKIVRKETKEILSVFEVTSKYKGAFGSGPTTTQREDEIIRDALKSLGVNVR